MRPETIATVCGAILIFLTQIVILISGIVSAKLTSAREKQHQLMMEADRHYVEAQLESRLKEERSHMAREMKIQTEVNAKALVEQTTALTAEMLRNRVVSRQARTEASAAFKEANEINRKLVVIGEKNLEEMEHEHGE